MRLWGIWAEWAEMGEMGDTGKNWEELRGTEKNWEGLRGMSERRGMSGMGELREAERDRRAETSWPDRNN